MPICSETKCPTSSKTQASRVYCELVAVSPEDDKALLGAILEAGFPAMGAVTSPLDASKVPPGVSAEEHIQRLRQPGVSHVFFADRAPLCEVLTLSRHMPAVKLTLKYRASEQADAGENGLAEFLGGELKQHVRAQGVPDDRGCDSDVPTLLGNWWLRGLAEKVLRSAYGKLFGDVEGGFDMGWKERMDMNLEFEAYERLKALLEPIDREIISVQETAYRVRLDLTKKRRAAADMNESFGKFVAKHAESDAAGELLTGDDLRHIKATAGILERIAGGVPATSQRV